MRNKFTSFAFTILFAPFIFSKPNNVPNRNIFDFTGAKPAEVKSFEVTKKYIDRLVKSDDYIEYGGSWIESATSIKVDDNNNIWVSNFMKTLVLDANHEIKRQFKFGGQLYFDQIKGRMWIGGANYLELKTNKMVSVPAEQRGLDPEFSILEFNDEIFLLTTTGLFTFNLISNTWHRVYSQPKDINIVTGLITKDEFYFLHRDGAFSVNRNTKKQTNLTGLPGIQYGQISRIGNSLVIASNNGYSEYDLASNKNKVYLPDEIRKMAIDNNLVYLAHGSPRNPLVFDRSQKIPVNMNKNTTPGLLDNDIEEVLVTKDKIYFGARSNVHVFDKNKKSWSKISIESDDKRDVPFGDADDYEVYANNGSVWAFSQNYLYLEHYEPSLGKLEKIALPGSIVENIRRDSVGNRDRGSSLVPIGKYLLVGDHLFDPVKKLWHPLGKANGLKGKFISALASDSKEIWIATMDIIPDAGSDLGMSESHFLISVFDAQSGKHLKDLPFNSKIQKICLNDNTVWILAGGLLRSDRLNFKLIQEPIETSGDAVTDIAMTENTLYIINDSNLYKKESGKFSKLQTPATVSNLAVSKDRLILWNNSYIRDYFFEYRNNNWTKKMLPPNHNINFLSIDGVTDTAYTNTGLAIKLKN